MLHMYPREPGLCEFYHAGKYLAFACANQLEWFKWQLINGAFLSCSDALGEVEVLWAETSSPTFSQSSLSRDVICKKRCEAQQE